jgi:hypothetical protein
VGIGSVGTARMAYPDQNEKDHAGLDRAVRKGKVKAVVKEDR